MLFVSCQTYYKELKVYPEDLKTVYIVNFQNQTFEPFVHQEIIDVLKEKFHHRKTLILKNEYKDAQYTLNGRLLLFRREVLLYNNEYEASSYKIDLILKMQVTNKNQQVIFDKEIYDSIRYSLTDGIKENDWMARRRLLEKISWKILNDLEKIILEDLKNTYGTHSYNNPTR